MAAALARAVARAGFATVVPRVVGAPAVYRPAAVTAVRCFATSSAFDAVVTSHGPTIAASGSNDVKLEFYGLYKQATAGDVATGESSGYQKCGARAHVAAMERRSSWDVGHGWACQVGCLERREG